MKTITKTYSVYQFSELSKTSQDKVLENYHDINVDFEWWDSIYYDSHEIGIDITGFDLGRSRSITYNILLSSKEIINEILKNHGESSDTYNTTIEHKDKILELYKIIYEDDCNDDLNYTDLEYNLEDLENEYFRAISEDYLSTLNNEYEWLTSKEGIVDTLKANDYHFTLEGEIS
jgi:hypothetical protein